jgi:hypothetical protein
MTADELHALLAEYRNPKIVIGELIYRRIQTVVKSLLSRRDPAIYARGLAGSDAVAEVAHDFVVDVLIEEGQLAYIFEVALTIDDFDRLLYFHAGRYLARSRVRTVVDNLIDRAVRFLRNADDIETLTMGKREVFVPKKTDTVQTAPDSERLLNRAVALAAAVPKLSSDGDQRAPAVYSADALEQVLRILVETYREPIGRTELDAFFSKLLTAWKPSFLGLDSDVEPEDRALLAEDEVLAMDLAVSLAERMTSEERDIFAFQHAHLPDRDLAAHLNLSRQSVSPRKQRLFRGWLADELCELSEEVKVAVLERLATVVAQKRSES